jgi:hypothetical protein
VVSALNYKGSMCNATFRLLRGSPEDIFLNGYLARMVADAPSFAPGMSAVFQKRIGIVTGDVISDTYNFAFGFPKKLPEVKENAEGATDQGLVMWSIVFGSSLRVL